MIIKWQRLRDSTFFMNALYLMLATLSIAGLGFVFWVIVAQSYSSATVGLSATLLSASGLISLLSLAGFDTTLVRFLPKSSRKNDYINSGIVIVSLTSAVLSLGFIMLLPVISPSLAFVRYDAWYALGFIFFTVATSLNVLTNAVFLAQKRARDILIINLFFSLLKVMLPILVVRGGVMTIFAMVGASQLFGLVLSLLMMKSKCGYLFSPRIHTDILRITRTYSLSVYISSILNLLPPTILPLIVIAQRGPEDAAYYYIVFTIASALYTIAYSSMQSAFAEGSYEDAAMRVHMRKAAKLIGLLLLPAAIILFALSDRILGIFGKEYAEGGSGLLRLFILSAGGVVVSSALGAIFKVSHSLREVVIMNIVYAGAILTLSYLLISRFGLIAVGWAWLIGTLLTAGVGSVLLMRNK